jgi:hypothetical protein
MRGHVDPQSHMFSYFSPEERVPAKHPLRCIKAYIDSALKQIRAALDGLYSEIGRPSIPPERLSPLHENYHDAPPLSCLNAPTVSSPQIRRVRILSAQVAQRAQHGPADRMRRRDAILKSGDV